VGRGDVLVQEVIEEIATEGEWSLVFIDGGYSHAMIKHPAPGDFRVQTELGGSSQSAAAPESLIAAAERIAARIPHPWLFARIDGVSTSRGFMLMEIECIEPHLFFDAAPGSRARLADGVRRAMTAAAPPR